MKISVIVPVYNVEKYVSKCISSVLKQSYSDFELLLVDDGSTDDSGKICDMEAGSDSRIKVIHTTNAGVVAARRTGINSAGGDYIVFIDGDDWVEPDYVSNFVKEIKSHQCDVVWSVSFCSDKDDHSQLQTWQEMVGKDYSSDESQNKMYQYVMGMSGFQNEIEYSACMKCIKTCLASSASKHVITDIHRGEDMLFSLYLLDSADSVRFVRNDGYHYVQRPGSNTNKQDGYSYDEYLRLQDAVGAFACTTKSFGLKSVASGYLLITYMNYFFGRKQGDKDYLFPFMRVHRNSRLIIYGAGRIGSQIMSFLSGRNDYTVVTMIDGHNNGKVMSGITIEGREAIEKYDFDYVILATNRSMFMHEMKEYLLSRGIDEDKIVSVFDDEIDYDTTL